MTPGVDLSAEHLATLLAIAAATAGLCVAARLWPGRWTDPAAAALGVFVVCSEAAWLVWLVAGGGWTPAVGLPLHLCDAATVLAAAALWTRRRVLVELLWFWACAGTLQALATPDVPGHFPAFLWMQYYASHGGVVAAALFLVVGLRIVPGPGAVLRAAALTAAYAAAVGAADLVTGGDYMYLRQPPPTPSMLDVMGPWPWYLASAAVLALVLFAVLDAPFSLARLWATRRDSRALRGRSPR